MFVNRLAVILFRLTNLMIILRIFAYYFKVDEAGCFYFLYVIILRTCVLLKNIHLGKSIPMINLKRESMLCAIKFKLFEK